MFTYIFDFDGTISDSLALVFEIAKQHSTELGCRQLVDSDIHLIRNSSSRELLKLLNIPLTKMPKFVLKIRKMLKSRVNELNSFPGLAETLKQLKAEEATLGILTSNSVENVEIFLKKHRMVELFDFVDSDSNLLGKAKKLQKLIKKNNINKNTSAYIGDETRDIEAAKKCDLRAVAVCWGFSSREVLEKSKPYKLISEPSDLLTIFSEC